MQPLTGPKALPGLAAASLLTVWPLGPSSALSGFRHFPV